MGLLPLEFSDCLIDSPYFRENLKAHEKQLDRVSELSLAHRNVGILNVVKLPDLVTD